MSLRCVNRLIHSRLGLDSSPSSTSSSNIPVSVSSSKASSAITPFSNASSRTTVIPFRLASVSFAPCSPLPQSAGGQLCPLSSSPHFGSGRAPGPSKLSLCPPHMSSSQPLGDGPSLLGATYFLSVEASPILPNPVPSAGELLSDFIGFSTTTEPHQPSVAIYASSHVPSSPLVLSSSVVLIIPPHRHKPVSLWEASAYYWEWPPGFEIHFFDPYQERTAPGKANIFALVA